MRAVEELWKLTPRQLRDELARGHAVDARALEDRVYRGTSLGLPAFVERLTWKVFRKVFHRDPATGLLRGWNVRLEQHGVRGPSVPVRKAGAVVSFGHYVVVDPRGRRMPRGTYRGLLLDYGLGATSALDTLGLLRDPIVALEEGSADLLLGWSFLDLGVADVPTPSFFTLEHEGALAPEDVVRAPRR